MWWAFLAGWTAFLLSLGLVGCQPQGGQGEGAGAAGSAFVHVRVGTPPPAPRATATRAAETRQRVGGIPPEVVQIILHVTTRGQPIPGSPFPIPLETGGTSVEITPNQEHRFAIEASNPRGERIFHGAETVNLPPNGVANLAIQLTAEVVRRPIQTQFVPTALGGDIVVRDPQSPVNGLRLRLFPAVLEQGLAITVTEVYNPLNVPILATQTGVIVDIEPSGTVFAAPVTLTFPYDSALVSALGIAEADLLVWRFAPALGRWQPVPNQRVDPARQVIVAQLTSLSLYTVGSAPPATPVPALQTLLFQLDVSPADDPLYRLAE